MKKDDEIQRLNEDLFQLDLDALEVEELEKRLELTLLNLPFGGTEFDNCGKFKCRTFVP